MTEATDGAHLRLLGARVILAVEGGVSLDESLPRYAEALEPRSRALVAELAYGVCRWYPRLAVLGRSMLKKLPRQRDRVIFSLLLIGLYQLLYTRIPAHAAVAETVEAAKRAAPPWAAGLINAVLRRFQREREVLLDAAMGDTAARYAHPAWLVNELRTAWPDRWEQVLEAGNQRPPMTLRVNQARVTTAEYGRHLAAAAMAARPVDGVPTALVLDSPVAVESLPGFDAGLVSVQDAAAQLAAPLLDAQAGDRVLDACAAPGGKTGHLGEHQSAMAALTAVDVDAGRLERVRENLRRLGLDARVQAGDAGRPEGDWAQASYDRILADVPCSATGVIRRHPDIKILRRQTDIAPLLPRQQAILESLWGLLRPGGTLVYATCSVLPKENRSQVAAFLARHADARHLDIHLPFGRACDPGWQILPGDAEADGFYYAKLEKRP
ncbi:MAG: 16S rRNA (cytosine(967)-C(5))-methyltransferase RsmB [Pseudomonadota bacterium]